MLEPFNVCLAIVCVPMMHMGVVSVVVVKSMDVTLFQFIPVELVVVAEAVVSPLQFSVHVSNETVCPAVIIVPETYVTVLFLNPRYVENVIVPAVSKMTGLFIMVFAVSLAWLMVPVPTKLISVVPVITPLNANVIPCSKYILLPLNVAVVFPVMVDSWPATVRSLPSVTVSVPFVSRLFHDMPFVFKVVEAFIRRVLPVTTTVPAVYVSVPVL